MQQESSSLYRTGLVKIAGNECEAPPAGVVMGLAGNTALGRAEASGRRGRGQLLTRTGSTAAAVQPSLPCPESLAEPRLGRQLMRGCHSASIAQSA